MLKELKYILYLLSIFLFIFFSLKYYISDDHKKKSYRSHKTLNEKINSYTKKLNLLKNDTKDIIIYVENNKNQNMKKYNFWQLLNND
tara:strand:+ start:792 stop:1052 length:261 start_codon:yes stop_codon:yes gene_type:complete